MPYDAMRVSLRVAMMKRQLMDIYLETIAARAHTRRSLRLQRDYQRILTDTSHAYVVMTQLYAHLTHWRTMHADEMLMPRAAASLGIPAITRFVDSIADKADLDAYSIGDFPERNTTHLCRWANGLHAPAPIDDDEDNDDYTPDALFGDEDDYTPDPLFGDEDNYTPDALFGDEGDVDGLAALSRDHPDDDEDADYPVRSDASSATQPSEIMPSDAYDAYFGWGLAAHHHHDMPLRCDFACADMEWHQPDSTLPTINDVDCRRLFGVYMLPPQPTKRVIYDIFGNVIGWQSVRNEDDPDYNVPGSA